MLDELLPRLKGDASFSHFQLDGQMAVVDDYLDVRPEQREALCELSKAGKLSMGPWYVLPDEFLVSGETLIRNLQLGIATAEEFGGAMQVGYLPDMFGHITSMPQILQLFGFDHAVVWRGVPLSINQPAFNWESPDGSAVRAEYLSGGYGNGSGMPTTAAELRERIMMFLEVQGELVGAEVLWMAGMDHESPPVHLSLVVAGLQAAEAARSQQHPDQEHLVVQIGSLSDYLRRAPTQDLVTHSGELRSGARANLLMGVTSNRVDVKIAAAIAERTLERLAEPLSALWAKDPIGDQPLLALAWLEVIRNAAHDSICACSHDEVVDAVLHRYAEATRTAKSVALSAKSSAASLMKHSGVLLLNPCSRDREEVIEIDLPTRALRAQTDASAHRHETAQPWVQVLSERPEHEELHVSTAADAPLIVARELIFEHPETVQVLLVDQTVLSSEPKNTPRVLEVHLLNSHSDAPSTALSPIDALSELGQRCERDPSLLISTVLHHREALARVLTLSGKVSGFGWSTWHAQIPKFAVHSPEPDCLSNGLISVAFNPKDGTYSVNGRQGYGQIIDEVDVGDTYNWCPVEPQVLIDHPESTRAEIVESGPIRGRLRIYSEYQLPACAPSRETPDPERQIQAVITTIELRSDEAILRVTTELDNRVKDHRMRVHFPLQTRAQTSSAECAFAVVQRPLLAEGGANEWGVPTYPSRRFVQAGDLTLTHEGLCEYELVDLDGDPKNPLTTSGALAVTLLRGTGWLSRGPMASRPLPAGPENPLLGAQVQKSLSLRYAISVEPLDPYEFADRAWSPLQITTSAGGGALDGSGTRLTVTGAEVDALLTDPEGRLIVRCHEPLGQPGRMQIPGGSGQIVDLLGNKLGAFSEELDLRPHQILTVVLDTK